MSVKDACEDMATPQKLLEDLYTNPMHLQYSRASVLRMIEFVLKHNNLKADKLKGAAMSELENVKPVAFYRADWKGDMMFRKDNTVVIRKNEGDFTTGWIKPLYDELPEPQPQLTIPKSIAEKTVGYFDKDRPNYFERSTRFVFSNWSSDLNGDNFDDSEFNKRIQIVGAYLNPLTRDLVKVVEG